MIDPKDLVVDIDLAATDHPILTLEIRMSDGVIKMMVEIVGRGRTLELVGMHMQSDSGPNAFGAARLRSVAIALMEVFDVDSVLDEGARRTTGAHPGSRKGPVRFTRKASA